MTPGDRAEELRRMKELDLPACAQQLGFAIDRRKSGRRSLVMKHPDGTKILISRDGDRHVWCDLHDGAANGTIVDFVQRRTGGTLGDVRRELRPLLAGGLGPAPQRAEARTRTPGLFAQKPHDPAALADAYGRTHDCDGRHPYLEARGVPPAVLADPIFAGRVRIDPRGNAVFPHFDRGPSPLDGRVCGWELKNRGFTSFSPGGRKGLWASRPRPTDDRLVVAEGGVDALSHAALFGTAGARYVSPAGCPGKAQLDLFAAACRKLPAGGTVVIAADADDAGQALAERLATVAREAGRTVRIDRPPTPGEDWNDVLRRTGAATNAVGAPAGPT